MSEISKVVVRMYRELLGDCFLIRVEHVGAEPKHIMIDCGILQGLAGGKERVRRVAENIAADTKGYVDVLVVTHEHHDHISGFAQARDILLEGGVKFDKVWMAWTEDSADETAASLRAAFQRRKNSVTHFASAFAEMGVTGGVDGLDNFFPDSLGLDAPGTGRLTGARILDRLKQISQPRFLRPGEIVSGDEAPLAAAVLGPPTDNSRLLKDSPSRGADKETYLAEELLGLSLAFDAAAPTDEANSLSSPFRKRFSEGLDTASVEAAGALGTTTTEWLNARYFAAKDAKEARPQQMRRIDKDWLRPFASLALKLDSDTNNTSLVLAFLLPDDSFLLFAADAQVGNWLSWHDQDYSIAGESLSAEEILNRTRFYKVGHHGSINATLRGRGLELITHPDLVAACSTVEAEARDQGSPPGWLMPNPLVKRALIDRCQGRFIRGDRRWREDEDVKDWHDKQGEFESRLDDSGELFVEYTVYERAGDPAQPVHQEV